MDDFIDESMNLSAAEAPVDSFEAIEETETSEEPTSEFQPINFAEEDRADFEDAPLESFFAKGAPSEEGDDAESFDKKIDEALELAERIRNAGSGSLSNEDELDVPAFLRNGMKDLDLT